MKKTKLELNHTCKICNGIIYLGNCAITNGESFHLDCLLDKSFQEGKLEERERCLNENGHFKDKCLCLNFKSQDDIDLFNEFFKELLSKIQSPSQGYLKHTYLAKDTSKIEGEKE